mmetsp:Transcript_6631/g.14521  ORF Transcript_6631/g.14521 Transcript_6631/m.14521 type:complete len:281 (-) Transcript_6631:65-907(-)
MEECANIARSVRRRTDILETAAAAAAAAAAGAAPSSSDDVAAASGVPPPPDVPVIPIPNLAPNLHCSGDAHRVIRTPGTSFMGTGVSNSAYFRQHECGILEMKTGVSFLDLKAVLRNVPCGQYEATVLIKCDAVSSFQADFSMSTSTASTSKNALRNKMSQKQPQQLQQKQYRPFVRFKSQYANDTGGRFLSSYQGKWIRLSFGLVEIPSSSTDVMFRIFGENSWWSRGLWFGDLTLRRVRLAWEKERLLLLCYHRRAGRDCPLQHLPTDVVRSIASWII